MSNKYRMLAEEVLEQAGVPMSYREIWDYAVKNGLDKKLGSYGKTPFDSIGAQLYTDVKLPNSIFYATPDTRPAKFFLKKHRADECTCEPKVVLPDERAKQSDNASMFKERELHPVLTYFVSSHPSFNRGRMIFTKTIFHEVSKSKGGFNEWTHPDMVGFYFPLDDWDENVIRFNDLTDKNSLRLFSFELKKSIHRSNYREAFFQAVSNSSWAHEGYLVTAAIEKDDDLYTEIGRLSSSFGIGVINLELADIASSRIIFPAVSKGILDWESINKLCMLNPNFSNFIEDVVAVCVSRRHNPSLFDSPPEDIEQYIENKLRIKQIKYQVVKG